MWWRRTLAEIEREAIERTLAECGGRKPEAAKRLRVSLKTLYNKLNDYRRKPPAPTAPINYDDVYAVYESNRRP